MEFFKIVNVKTSEQIIQEELILSKLEEVTTEIFNLEEPSENEAKIGGIWGEFTLSRQKIKGGLRFALVECPNALCWTVTTGYPPDRASVIIHLTINRLKKNPEFIEEIEEFLSDHSVWLKHFFTKILHH